MDKLSVLHWVGKDGSGGVIRGYEDWGEARGTMTRLQDEDEIGRTYFVDEVPFVAKDRNYGIRRMA